MNAEWKQDENINKITNILTPGEWDQDSKQHKRLTTEGRVTSRNK